MFTGIITALGSIESAEQKGDLRARIACPFDPAKMAIGASIACSGVCLTVVERGGQPGDAWFAVDISGETISCTVPGMWEEGRTLNLEAALRMGDELGGHIVTGHVDAVGSVVETSAIGDSTRLVISAPADLAPYIAAKGSITVDGASLTVNTVEDQPDGAVHFTLNIIPHTAQVTTLGTLVKGSAVNLEIDTMARYLQRMQSLRG
ncbi:riboflavin synthase [Altererythrobacter confluentis]|uniref:Riboflavin synthase n=1 Tax=Allopontixanthobacter confluentis TaxID=1849021 RepID=A0A6L7GDM2_9SPHN|nr:riboflavin synthase [Allopontixanthobacter confluentis]MXP13228.1 riboflavin synthase [Allopontixanthobacter confluentis]